MVGKKCQGLIFIPKDNKDRVWKLEIQYMV